MAASNDEDPLSFRAAVAVGVTLFAAYLVFLFFDIQNGWGLGWYVLGVAVLVLVGIALASLLVIVWVWVYNGLPHRVHARANRK